MHKCESKQDRRTQEDAEGGARKKRGRGVSGRKTHGPLLGLSVSSSSVLLSVETKPMTVTGYSEQQGC